MDWIQHKFLNILSGRLRNFKRLNDKTYNFSCPICGDSTKSKRKARAYVYDKKGQARFHCHNCGRDFPIGILFQEVDTQLYSDYQIERISEGLWTPSGRRRKSGGESIQAPVKVQRTALPIDSPPDFLSVLTLAADHPKARAVLEKRVIPGDKYKHFYHCPLFYHWVNWVKPGTFEKKALDRDEPRLVIPFLDKKGMMYALQGRSYQGSSEAKYITIRVDDSVPKVFGLYDADRTKTVYAFEGPIDSMFVDNSVAFAGGNHAALSGFEKTRTVVVYDNEPSSPHTIKKMERAIRDGHPIVIWPKSIVEKDVNDMVIAGMPRAHLEDILLGSTYSGLSAEAELSFWRRA